MNPACSTPIALDGKATVAAILSPPGRGALAVVGVVGPHADAIVTACFRPRAAGPLSERPDGAILFGSWVGPPRAAGALPAEDLVVVKRSSTSLEIHPHGGRAAAERVLADLEASGGRRADWAGFLSATGLSIVEVEIRLALASATGPKAASTLARQLSACGSRDGDAASPGLLERSLGEIRRLAAEGRTDEAATRAGRLLAWAPLGLHLVRPWRVVVAGPPNAGKSSLVNAIAGYSRSIVSSEAGTTRDLIETRIVVDGWEIDLVDTAGLRDAAAAATEREGIDRARAAAGSADLVLEATEATRPRAASRSDAGLDDAAILRVATKADLAGRPSSTEQGDGRLPTSAVTGQGVDTLLSRIVRRLVPEEPQAGDPVPFTPRQVAELQLAVVSGAPPRTASSPPRPPHR